MLRLLLPLCLVAAQCGAQHMDAAGAVAQQVTADRFHRYPYPPPLPAHPAGLHDDATPGTGEESGTEGTFVASAHDSTAYAAAKAPPQPEELQQGWRDAVASVLEQVAARQAKSRLVYLTSPSHLVEMSHALWQGRQPYCTGFRVLVAGGGTGEKTLQLATQLRDVGSPHEIVHLDASKSAVAAARERLRDAGLLGNVVLLHKRIEDLSPIDDGVFDYIDCQGVVHHTRWPVGAMRALRRVMHPGGGLALAVYGAEARVGVRRVQRLLALAFGDGDPSAVPANRTTLRAAAAVLRALPRTHPLHADAATWQALAQAVSTMGDAGLADLFLPGIEHAFTVDTFRALAEGTGFCLAEFSPPAAYRPSTYAYTLGEEVDARVKGMDAWETARVAELLSGNLYHIMAYLRPRNGSSCPEARPPTASPDASGLYPIPFRFSPSQLSGAIARAEAFEWKHHTLELSGHMSVPARAALLHMDGHRTLAQIAATLRDIGIPEPWGPIREAFDVLHGAGRLHLSEVPLRADPGVDCSSYTGLECQIAQLAHAEAVNHYTVPQRCPAHG